MKKLQTGAWLCMLALVTGCEAFRPPSALDRLENTAWSGTIESYRENDFFQYDVKVQFGENNTGSCRVGKRTAYESYPLWYSGGKLQLNFRIDNYSPIGMPIESSLTLSSNYWKTRHLELEGTISAGDTGQYPVRLILNLEQTP